MVVAALATILRAGIAFSAPAAPASRLLPDLGKAVSVRMEAAPALAREFLVIAVKGATLDGLMARIAQAMGGEWTQQDGTYRLGLSASVAAKDCRSEENEREAVWRNAVAQDLGYAARRPSDDQGRSVVAAFLGALPAGTLGALGLKERVVYSTRPTPRQRPLPDALLRRVDLAALLRVRGPVVDGVPSPPAGQAAVVQITLQTQGGGRELVTSLITADAHNLCVGGASITLDAEPIEDPKGGKPSDPPAPPRLLPVAEDERRQALALAALDRFGKPMDEFRQGYPSGDRYDSYGPDELKDEAVVRSVPELLNPERTEPLALTAGPLLTRYEQAEGTNLVADLPDAAFLPARALLAERTVSVEGVREASHDLLDLDLRSEGGWIVVLPHRAVTARASRLDRATLGKALRSLTESGLPTLDAQAAYAAAQPVVPPDETFEGALLGAVDPSYGKRIATSGASGERLLLRLYRLAGHGSGVDARPAATLPTEARALLDALAYGSIAGPSVSPPVGDPPGRRRFHVLGGPGRDFWSLDTERTVFWPDGIPTDATLKITESTAPAVFGLASNGATPRIPEQGSGYSMTFTDHGPVVTSNSLPKLERYARGSVRTVTFTLSGSPRAVFRRTLVEERLDPKAPTLAYGELPENLRKHYDELDERLRGDIERYRATNGGTKP